MRLRLPAFLLALTFVMTLAVGLSAPACAQIFGDEEPAKINFGQTNKEMQDMLTLQYQLQVLKRLIEHERAVNNMVQSAISIGVLEPVIDKPNETMCSEIPANIPCAQAYRDMYENYSVERKAPASPVLPPAASLASGDVPALDAGALPALPAAATEMAATADGDIFWADITCLSGKCTAIITPAPTDPKARYRVSMGETLPDGSVISAISAAGVSIERKGKTIDLAPAPKA